MSFFSVRLKIDLTTIQLNIRSDFIIRYIKQQISKYFSCLQPLFNKSIPSNSVISYILTFFLIILGEESVTTFFNNLFQRGADARDCNQYLSVLLERACNEKCIDTMYPVISEAARRVQEISMEATQKNHIIPSIH